MKGFVLTYILTYGGAAVALFNPFVGAVIYWTFAIVRPQHLYAWAGLRGSFSEIVAIATLIGWALKGFGNWRLGRATPVVVLLIGYLAWVILSAMFAPLQGVAWSFVREQSKIVLMFVVAVTLADTPQRARALAWTLVGSMGYLCFEFNLEYLRGTNTLHAYGFGGMDNNSLAISIVTAIAPAGFLGIYERRFWARATAWLCAAFAGHAVLLSFSRGGMLGLLISGLVAVSILPKRPKYLLPVLLAGLLVLRFAGPQVRSRFFSTFDEEQRDASSQTRISLWLACVDVMRQNPLLGIGPDHFPWMAPELGFSAGKEAHSLWLQLGAEIGIPGVLCLLLFYGTILRRLLPLLRRGPPDDLSQWFHLSAGMVVAGLLGFVISAQFVSMKGLETPYLLVGVGVATLRLAAQRRAQESVVVERPSQPAAFRQAPQPVYRPGVIPRSTAGPSA